MVTTTDVYDEFPDSQLDGGDDGGGYGTYDVPRLSGRTDRETTMVSWTRTTVLRTPD